MRKSALFVGIALVATVGLTGCGGGGNAGGGAGAKDLGTVEMTDDLKFKPATFSGAPGEYKFKLVNKGTQDHDFSIAGTSIKHELAGGESKDVTITLEKAAKYEIICNQPGHKDGGMKGTFEVK